MSLPKVFRKKDDVTEKDSVLKSCHFKVIKKKRVEIMSAVVHQLECPPQGKSPTEARPVWGERLPNHCSLWCAPSFVMGHFFLSASLSLVSSKLKGTHKSGAPCVHLVRP